MNGAAVPDVSAIGSALRGIRWGSDTLVELLQQATVLAGRLGALKLGTDANRMAAAGTG